jgi:hypothetical protein
MGLLGWLTLLFVAFKLAGIINWSWIAVFAPIWIPVSIILVLYAIFSLVR